MPAERPPGRLVEIARLFGRLSLTSFGGPAAHIAVMRQELVDRRGWFTDAEFLDLVGASNVIPGPTSTEVALHAGRRRAGTPGLLVAGLAFIGPAAVVMAILGWAYARYGSTPALDDIFDGVKPAVVAVVAIAVGRLARAALRTRLLAAVAVVALGLYVAGVTEPVLLLASAAVAAVVARHPAGPSLAAVLPAAGTAGIVWTATAGGAVGLGALFLVFAKVGTLLFGSGYVLFAFLQRDVVEVRGWLTEAQLIDAVAVGQFTPGPLFTTATFVGYLLRGPAGAIVATLAIFLPCFAMVAALGPVVARLRRSPTAAAALDGLNAAAVALMAGVTLILAREAVTDVATALIAAASAAVLLRFGLNAAWVIAAAAVAGVVLASV